MGYQGTNCPRARSVPHSPQRRPPSPHLTFGASLSLLRAQCGTLAGSTAEGKTLMAGATAIMKRLPPALRAQAPTHLPPHPTFPSTHPLPTNQTPHDPLL